MKNNYPCQAVLLFLISTKIYTLFPNPVAKYMFFYKNTAYKNVTLEKLKNQEHCKNNKA